MKKIDRYLTFTFDDCLLDGAKKIDKILNPYKATFYIVTGWLGPNPLPITDESNINLNHGTLDDWKELSERGHDIGSHSVTHNTHNTHDAKEFDASLEVIKEIHNGPYSAAFPHNKVLSITSPYHTIRVGYEKKLSNDLENVDLHNIISWGPWPQSLNLFRIKWKVNHVPSKNWLVFNLHSLDGEGWHPWTSRELASIKNYALRKGFQIKTMADMYKIIKETPRI